MNETVWSSWDEWRAVYTQLYSTSLDQKNDACKRISAWSIRGRLPLPVRTTYSLVEAQLLDHGSSSIEQVRLSYAMALVRLVNNAADDGQRGEYAQSIAILANRIGLPKWLVDVRHEATHQSLPSLQVLRLACAQALQWLDEHYWKRQWEELSKSHPNRLDARVAEISECLSRGAISRDVGPSLPVNLTATSTTAIKTSTPEPSQDSLADADDEPVEELGATRRTAQDIVDSIKEYDVNRLAKSLFRVMMSEGEQFDWTRWERVLHWLDGEGSLRVCRKLLLVCLHEALKEGDASQQRKVYLLICGLLSRRYHAETRASLAKHASKTLTIESSETWTKQERAFMNSFAPDACRSEVLAAVKRCLNRPSPQARKLLIEILLPSLLKVPGPTTTKKSKTSQAAEQVYETVDSLFQLHNELIRLDEHVADNDKESVALSKTKESEQVLDWTTLTNFCDQVDQHGRKRFKQNVTDGVSEVKLYDELNGDGSQVWTRVEWPRIPIGAVLNDPKRCPSLSLSPPLFVGDTDGSIGEPAEETLSAASANEANPGSVEVGGTLLDGEAMRKMITETSKKIRLLL